MKNEHFFEKRCKERIDLVFDKISQHIGEDNYVLFDTIYDVVNYLHDNN